MFDQLFKTCNIFIILLFNLIQGIESEVTKCCSDQNILNIQSHACESSGNKTIWEFNTIQSSSLSNCSEHQYVSVKNQSYIELNGCIDKDRNDEYVAISCLKFPTIGVHLMNKCCPFGKAYNHTERVCTENPEISGHYKTLFGNTTVVFENNIPDCSDEEVFVEYISTIHNMKFFGNNLVVNSTTLLPNKFCIEDLINIKSNVGKNNEKNFIVRSCRPRSICSEIPCIRRCCKADQVMYPQPKGKRKCQFHPNKKNLAPIFYDIKLPLNAEQTILHLEGITHIF